MTITLTREEAQQVLDALDGMAKDGWLLHGPEGMDKTQTACLAAIETLRIRLAQPEPEPVAWMYVNEDGECEQIEYGEVFDDPSVTPLYTAPPQREWQGLTDEERYLGDVRAAVDIEYARAIEAKLKEKNAE